MRLSKRIIVRLSLLSVLFILQILTPAATAASRCHADDEAGLLAFKSGITRDPSNLLSNWKAGTDCCSWDGISCQTVVNKVNRVNSISIYGTLEDTPNDGYLTGTISPSLAKLTYLDGIYLFDLRQISGPFPTVFFRLPHLLYIYIENSNLSSPLPSDIGNLTKLVALSFQGNRFSGPIPASISKLTQLTQLKLGRNSFTGGIPPSIRNLKQLNYLSLEQNRLTGYIPEIFSSFPQLKILNLSYNGFTGQIPKSISSLSKKLQSLEITHNRLTGKIPTYLGNFTTMDTLDLSRNKLTGTIPTSFTNLINISNLRLSHNYLLNPFPQMHVKGIQSLDLSYNKFKLGKIPTWVMSSPIINSLKLAGCGLNFNINDFKPSETYFYDFIDLSDNEIFGSPVALVNSTDYLVGFWASGNKMKFDLGKIKFNSSKLKFLDISRNLVYGKVPDRVAKLEELNVSHNHLCGRIPATKFLASSFLGNDCLCGFPLPFCKKNTPQHQL